MLKSMTGFGRGEAQNEQARICVEIKSVNHRYLDLGIKTPKRLNSFEGDIRNAVKGRVVRGKVDIYISCEDYSDEQIRIVYHPLIAKSYLDYCNDMERSFNIDNDLTASMLCRLPEVFTVANEDDEEKENLWPLVKEALDKALEKLDESRLKEGANLFSDFCDKLSNLENVVAEIEKIEPEIIESYKNRLYDKIKEVLGETWTDESRITMEAAIYADKVCTDEETVRLKSHINSMRDSLSTGKSVGRRLDFIAQEMNREANTILSKAGNLLVSDCGITLKTEIEKIREQIQNIE